MGDRALVCLVDDDESVREYSPLAARAWLLGRGILGPRDQVPDARHRHAGELGLSEIKVRAHRGQVILKMDTASLADPVNVAAILGIGRNKKSPLVTIS
jgi:FixJ family two-component response regulator